MISVYVTCKDSEEAKRIARHLLEKRLIACANIFPATSMFWWDEQISEEHEAVLIAKTQEKHFGEIKKEVTELHSYTVPCIVALEWKDSSEAYARWAQDETTQ